MTPTTDATTKRRTLFEITDDMLAFFDLVDDAESDEQVDAILEAWFSENCSNLHDKADGYAAVIREFEHRAAAREAEAKRQADAARAMKNRAKSLKYRLLSAMDWLQLNRLETDLNTFSVCKNGGKLPLDIHDPERVPDAYAYQVREIDRDKLRAALEAGTDIPGAILQERGRHLRIK